MMTTNNIRLRQIATHIINNSKLHTGDESWWFEVSTHDMDELRAALVRIADGHIREVHYMGLPNVRDDEPDVEKELLNENTSLHAENARLHAENDKLQCHIAFLEDAVGYEAHHNTRLQEELQIITNNHNWVTMFNKYTELERLVNATQPLLDDMPNIPSVTNDETDNVWWLIPKNVIENIRKTLETI